MLMVGLLARRLFDDMVAERAMVLFAVFPGSFVLSFAYAEAMFIVLAAVCFWYLLDERWVLAGLAAALAGATRPNGLAAHRRLRRRVVARHPPANGPGRRWPRRCWHRSA